MQNNCITLSFIVSIILISGCASTYPCGEPSSGKCMSVSDNYKRSYTNYSNPDDVDKIGYFSSGGISSNTTPVKMGFTKYAQVPTSGAPLLSSPKMIRIWLTPYTDNDNIYHDQSYEYVIVDRGSWNYSNNKLLLENNLKNVSPSQVVSPNLINYGSQTSSKPAPNPASQGSLTGFPAINGLQQQRSPTLTTTTVGSGIDRTTAITP